MMANKQQPVALNMEEANNGDQIIMKAECVKFFPNFYCSRFLVAFVVALIVGLLLGLIIVLIMAPFLVLLAKVAYKEWSLHFTKKAVHYHPAAFGERTYTVPLSYIEDVTTGSNTVSLVMETSRYCEVVNQPSWVLCVCCRERVSFDMVYVKNADEFGEAIKRQLATGI